MTNQHAPTPVQDQWVPPVTQIYGGAYTKGAIGYCYGSNFKHWIMWQHPDGQWVSLGKLPENVIRACNAHDDLVAALEMIKEHCLNNEFSPAVRLASIYTLVEMTLLALAKAKAGA